MDETCEYILNGQKCTEEAVITCTFGSCEPATRYCDYHYAQKHLLEDERDEVDRIFHPDKEEEKEGHMTLLVWNNDAGRYQAQVEDVGLVEVDGDSYAECRSLMMKDLMRTRELGEDLDALPGSMYDGLYDEAEHEIEQAEAWLDTPMDGLYINGVAQFDA